VPQRAGSPAFSRRLGARIRALREEVGLTQESVAWACEIPKPHLSRIESGKGLPSIPILFALAKHLKVEAADLVGFDMRKPRLALADAARRGDAIRVRTALKRLGLT
jgi:transcriptional regulator with XRE-family HTH domain